MPAIVKAAKAKGCLVGCDNTWATPLIFKPLAHGADFACEALTKYVGGHSDLLLGSITVSDMALRQKLKELLRGFGVGISPDECQLALRGIETMGLRVAHMGRVSEDFAKRLAHSPAVETVLHPALPSCPGHEHWKRDMGRSSGVFSLVLKPVADDVLEAALTALKVFAIGASWGGTRSLIAPMAVKGDRSVVPWTKEARCCASASASRTRTISGTTSTRCSSRWRAGPEPRRPDGHGPAAVRRARRRHSGSTTRRTRIRRAGRAAPDFDRQRQGERR